MPSLLPARKRNMNFYFFLFSLQVVYLSLSQDLVLTKPVVLEAIELLSVQPFYNLQVAKLVFVTSPMCHPPLPQIIKDKTFCIFRD